MIDFFGDGTNGADLSDLNVLILASGAGAGPYVFDGSYDIDDPSTWPDGYAYGASRGEVGAYYGEGTDNQDNSRLHAPVTVTTYRQCWNSMINTQVFQD